MKTSVKVYKDLIILRRRIMCCNNCHYSRSQGCLDASEDLRLCAIVGWKVSAYHLDSHQDTVFHLVITVCKSVQELDCGGWFKACYHIPAHLIGMSTSSVCPRFCKDFALSLYVHIKLPQEHLCFQVTLGFPTYIGAIKGSYIIVITWKLDITLIETDGILFSCKQLRTTSYGKETCKGQYT